MGRNLTKAVDVMNMQAVGELSHPRPPKHIDRKGGHDWCKSV